MIIYGVVSGTSISELFIAGVGPGLLILVLFSIYCVVYAIRKKIPTEPKASWKERGRALCRRSGRSGFPRSSSAASMAGFFSPTEAASVCVLYAIILELVVFRVAEA